MVVEWRTKKRIANSLSPMLPTTIKIVIVVIVASTYLVGYGLGVVVVEWATLVGCFKILIHDVAHEPILWKFDFKTYHAVKPTILQEHLRVIFEKMIVVTANTPITCLPGIVRHQWGRYPRRIKLLQSP